MPSENREPLVICYFQGLQNGNINQKWVKKLSFTTVKPEKALEIFKKFNTGKTLLLNQLEIFQKHFPILTAPVTETCKLSI